MKPAWKKESKLFPLKLVLAALFLLIGAAGTLYAVRVFYWNGSFLSPVAFLLAALTVPLPVSLAVWLMCTASASKAFRKKLLSAMWWFFLVLYCVLLVFVLFGGGRRDYDYSYLRPNLVPFSSIANELKNAFGVRFDIRPVVGLIGNAALFFPLGFLLPWKMRGKYPKTASSLLLLFAVGAAELLQQLLVVGVFDVDDILLNFVGILIGVAAQGIVQRAFSKKRTAALSS